MSVVSREVPADPPTSSEVGGSTVSGAGWLGLGAATVKAAQTVVLLVLAALLAPSAIGVIAVGSLVLNVTSAITDLGSSTALVHWRGDAERAARSALTLALTLAVLITAAVWVVAPFVSRTLQTGDEGTGVIRGLMLCLPFSAVAGVSQELLRRSLAFRRRVLPDIVGAVSGAVLSVSMATAGHGPFSLVYGQLLQAVLVMVLCWWMRPVVRPGWSRGDVSGLLSYGAGLAGANILTLLMLNVDYLVVAHRLGAAAVGVYSMSFRLAYMPYLLVGMVIGGAAFAHLCRLELRQVGPAVTDTAVVLFRLVLPLYVGIFLLAPHLALLGSQWAPGVPALRWLAVYGLLLSVVHLCEITLNAIGRTRSTLLVNAVHLVLLTSMLLTWAGRGVTLAAAAQVVAALATLIVGLTMVARAAPDVGWSRLPRLMAPALLGGLLMCLVVAALSLVWPYHDPSVPRLLVLGTAAVAAYLLPTFVFDRSALTVRWVR